jgi:hypothetical protein
LGDFTNVWLRRLVYLPREQVALVDRVLASFRSYLWPFVSALSKADADLCCDSRTGMPDVRDHLALELSSLADRPIGGGLPNESKEAGKLIVSSDLAEADRGDLKRTTV